MTNLEAHIADLLKRAEWKNTSTKTCPECFGNKFVIHPEWGKVACSRCRGQGHVHWPGYDDRVLKLQARIMAEIVNKARGSWDDSPDDYILAAGHKVLDDHISSK